MSTRRISHKLVSTRSSKKIWGTKVIKIRIRNKKIFLNDIYLI